VISGDRDRAYLPSCILSSPTFYWRIALSETISGSVECNLRLWYSSQTGPHTCRSPPRSFPLCRIWADKNLIRHNLSSVYVSCLCFLSRLKNKLRLSFVKTVLNLLWYFMLRFIHFVANVTILLFIPTFLIWYFCFPHQCMQQDTFVSTKISERCVFFFYSQLKINGI